MKDKPILFSGEMVKAILDGRKTQTRRVMQPQPPLHWKRMDMETMIGKGWRREYAVGWRLWVRESAYIALPNFSDGGNVKDDQGRLRTVGWAANMSVDTVRAATDYGVKKTPSIHMPRWASRITLEVTAVRVERVQDITEQDAIAEGIANNCEGNWQTCPGCYRLDRCLAEGEYLHYGRDKDDFPAANARESFQSLWDKINARRGYSWESNPYVWVVEFKQVKP